MERFSRHKERMHYARFRSMGIPGGSCAIESSEPRFVNLRLKGNGIFCIEENAEGLLLLHAHRLIGRWDEFMWTIFQPEASLGHSTVHQADRRAE